MSLTLNNTRPQMPNSQGNANGEKRPPSVHWLNVGVDADIIKDDGTVERQFISLPLGIPLDYQEKATVGANSTNEWRQIAAVRNHILELLQQGAAQQEPGGREYINGLKVQVAKAGERQAASDTSIAAVQSIQLSLGAA